jgi:hypothetical protein
MQTTVWQQGLRKLIHDSTDGSWDFISPGYVKWNGQVIGLSGGVFDGTPIQADLIVTGDQGDGINYIPRYIQLGDRAPLPIDRQLGSLTATPAAYYLPVGKSVRQLLGLSALRTRFGGAKQDESGDQVLTLRMAATNDGPDGTVGWLAETVVSVVNTMTNATLCSVTLGGVGEEILTGTGPLAFANYDITFPITDVSAGDVPLLALQIEEVPGKTSMVTTVWWWSALEDIILNVQAAEVDGATSTPLGFDLLFTLDYVPYEVTSIGNLFLNAQVKADIDLAAGVRVDGVDISEFFADYDVFKQTALDAITDATIDKEKKIPYGPTEPANPDHGDKWVDTSSLMPTWRIWDQTANGNAGAWVVIAPGGVDVDALFRDLIVRNLAVTGMLLGNMQVEPGATIDGVDLSLLKQQVDLLSQGQYANDLVLGNSLYIGRWTTPLADIVNTDGVDTPYPSTGGLGTTEILAQTFVPGLTGDLVTLTLKIDAQAAGGQVQVQVYTGNTPGSGTLIDEHFLPVMVSGAQDLEFVFSQPTTVLKGDPYYFTVEAIDGAQMQVLTGGTAVTDGAAYLADNGPFAPLAPATDLKFSTSVMHVGDGTLTVVGETKLFGDVFIEGTFRVKDSTIYELRTVTENGPQQQSDHSQRGSTGKPGTDTRRHSSSTGVRHQRYLRLGRDERRLYVQLPRVGSGCWRNRARPVHPDLQHHRRPRF